MATEREPDPYASYMPRRRFLDRWRALLGAAGVGIGGGYSFDYGPIDEERELTRARWRRVFWGALAVSGVVFVAYAIVPDDSVIGSLSAGMPAIEGSVRAALHPSTDPDTPESLAGQGFGAPAAAPEDSDGRSAPDLAGDARASVGPAAQSQHGTITRADVVRQLAIVRADLNRNSLWPARRAIRSALVLQPGNADAQRLLAELGSRERERDALLRHARLCAHRGEWVCVRQYASRAANVDRSSREAQRLVARASGTRKTVVAHRGLAKPDIFGRLRRWFERSVAQNRARPSRPLASWERP